MPANQRMNLERTCKSCFYAYSKDTAFPCSACEWVDESTNSLWVSVAFLEDVEDAGNVEGEQVMDNMVEQLERIKELKGVKYDSDKPKWSLLPLRALQEVVEVLTFGAKKYAADNWKHVPQARERYIDAAYRHLADWNTARLDPETNKSHLAHAICCLLFLLWFEQSERSETL